MSYSFSVSARTKADVLVKAEAELKKVVENQPIHAQDEEPAQTLVKSLVALLPDQEERDFGVSVNGSIWVTEEGVQQTSVSASAGMSTK